jgi:hypothetical protein
MRTRLPHIAREIFAVIRAYMPWMETGAGPVELLIGLDNRQWRYRFMITDGVGRSLLPPETSPGEQGGAAEGGAGNPEEVRLEEYRGWSQSTWTRDKEGGQGASTRENRGSRNGDRGGATVRGLSPQRDRSTPANRQRGTCGPQRGRRGHPTPIRRPRSPPNARGRPVRSAAVRGRAGAELPDPSSCEGSPFLTREECLDCFSHQGLWTPCSGWPS